MKIEEANKVADEVLDLYMRFGNEDYIGEPVSQIEHMTQAAQLAERENYDEEVVLAAFFHDIGHLCEHIMEVEYMDDYGIVDHEKIGAIYLSGKGFSKRITKLIASHVDAKRYLTYKNPAYYEKLSEASRKTLAFQGGKMSREEAAQFENDELFTLYLTLRNWDEMAKEENIPLPPLEHFRQLIIHHLIIQKP
jgi:phosphonate degradation associated HDIG domain protein